ncbi:MAG: methyltransferase domain-containing protein [Magnetococcus sp. MYC-9]
MTEDPTLEFHPRTPLDERRLGRAWQRAAAGMASEEGLLARIGQQLMERLDEIRLTPARVLVVGDRTGLMADRLQKRWPRAEICAAARVEWLARSPSSRRLPWQRRPWHLVAEPHRLPFARGRFDLVISSMALHWSRDLPAALREMRRVLAPDRLLLFTVAGAGTLQELHSCLARMDQERHGHGWVRGPELPSLSGLGELLAASGFVLPVVDRDRIPLPVPDLPFLLQQLRALGAGNHMRQRPAGLLGKGYFKRLEDAYQASYRLADGRLACTLELLFGHAWKGGAS